MSDPTPDITEEMTEQAARVLAALPGSGVVTEAVWCIRLTVEAREEYRATARRVLSVALAGRALVALPDRSVVTAEEVTFPGCTHSNPDLCACDSWAPPTCDACDQELAVGDDVFFAQLQGLPWLPAGHQHQEHSNWLWHVKCDQRAAAEGGDSDA